MTSLLYNKSIITNSSTTLNVQFLKDNNLLDTISSGRMTINGVIVDYWSNTRDSNPYFRVSYQPNNTKYHSYPIILVKTPCNFGGSRFWFTCPLETDGKPCEKRVGKLHFHNDLFGCRKCFNKSYKPKK